MMKKILSCLVWSVITPGVFAIEFQHDNVVDALAKENAADSELQIFEVMPPLTEDERNRIIHSQIKANIQQNDISDLEQEEKVKAPAQKPSPAVSIDMVPDAVRFEPASRSALILDPRVARASFTTKVKNKEPQNNVGVLLNKSREIFFYTDLLDMKGDTAIHKWYHNNELASEVKFKVTSKRWRVWSRKDLPPAKLGTWKVGVYNAKGELLAEHKFEVAEQLNTAKR